MYICSIWYTYVYICTNEVQKKVKNSVANVDDDLSGGFNFCHIHEIWLCFRWRREG